MLLGKMNWQQESPTASPQAAGMEDVGGLIRHQHSERRAAARGEVLDDIHPPYLQHEGGNIRASKTQPTKCKRHAEVT
jgi:hypothetical protein